MKNNNQNKRLNTLNIIWENRKLKKNNDNLFTSIVYGTYKQYIAATTTVTTTKSNSNKQKSKNSNEASNKKQWSIGHITYTH